MVHLDLPGMQPGQMGMINLSDMFGKAFGTKTRRRRMGAAALASLAAHQGALQRTLEALIAQQRAP